MLRGKHEAVDQQGMRWIVPSSHSSLFRWCGWYDGGDNIYSHDSVNEWMNNDNDDDDHAKITMITMVIDNDDDGDKNHCDNDDGNG